MKMFKYKDENTLQTITFHGLEVEVYFKDDLPEVISVDGTEWDITDDTLFGIYVSVKDRYNGGQNNFYNLSSLINIAADEYHEIMEGVRLERAAEERHARTCVAGKEKF